MKEALYYTSLNSGAVQCRLCPHHCRISEEKYGICGTRINREGTLLSVTYGRLSSLAIDPVEKKPLYHFYPSSKILSIGSYGCTMHCSHCQNASISQCKGTEIPEDQHTTYNVIFEKMLSHKTRLLAFTYNEPVSFFEYMLDIASVASDRNLLSVMVSNGYINPEPLELIARHISAFNIDLKAFTEYFYKKYTGASLAPVLEIIQYIRELGKHLELTYLVIPGLNDDLITFSRMVEFIEDCLGNDQVLHISRYFPNYRMNISPTPIDTIDRLVSIARERLNFVYAGNTGNMIDSSTYCPACHSKIIERSNYTTKITGMDGNSCAQCGHEIYGIFQKE